MADKVIVHKTLCINVIGEPDINLVTETMIFPLDTVYVQEDGRRYRYTVDEKGYRWIGEELWEARR